MNYYNKYLKYKKKYLDLLYQKGGSEIEELLTQFAKNPEAVDEIIQKIINSFDKRGTVEVILCKKYLSGELKHPKIRDLIERFWRKKIKRRGKKDTKPVNRELKAFNLHKENDIDIICYLTILIYQKKKVEQKIKTTFKDMQIECIKQSLDELRSSNVNSIVSFTEIPKKDVDIDRILNSDEEIQVFRYIKGGLAIAIKTTEGCVKTEPTKLLEKLFPLKRERYNITRECRFFKIVQGTTVYVPIHLVAGVSPHLNESMKILYRLIKENLDKNDTIILLGDGNGHLNSTKTISDYIGDVVVDENLNKIKFKNYGKPTGFGAVNEADYLLGIDIIGSNKLDELFSTELTHLPYGDFERNKELDEVLDIEGLSDHKRLQIETNSGFRYIIASNLGYHKIFYTIIHRISAMSHEEKKYFLRIFYSYLTRI